MKLIPKSVNALAVLPKRKYFRPGFGGAEVGFVERRHDIKREAGELEADENHEQFFAADEQHQSDRGEQKHARDTRRDCGEERSIAREKHSEKGERETDDLE